MGNSTLNKIVVQSLSETPLHYNTHSPTVYFLGGKIGRDDLSLMRFDDSDVVLEKEVIHIDAITFLYEKYIVGMTIYFNINGKRVVAHHKNSSGIDVIEHKVFFAQLEHIIEITTTWTKAGIHSLTGKTNYGQEFSVEGLEGYGTSFKIERFLKNKGEVAVGFQGFLDNYVQSLTVICFKPITANFPLLVEVSRDSTPRDSEDDNNLVV